MPDEARDPVVDPVTGWPVVARIWRTVDVERTVAELGLEPEPLGEDQVIGGRGVLVRPAEGPPTAILEPSTEGRLAAALARHGEGDAGFYAAPPDGLDEARRSGARLSAEAAGPFGRSALFMPGPPLDGGPLIIIVESPPATIDA